MALPYRSRACPLPGVERSDAADADWISCGAPLAQKICEYRLEGVGGIFDPS